MIVPFNKQRVAFEIPSNLERISRKVGGWRLSNRLLQRLQYTMDSLTSMERVNYTRRNYHDKK